MRSRPRFADLSTWMERVAAAASKACLANKHGQRNWPVLAWAITAEGAFCACTAEVFQWPVEQCVIGWGGLPASSLLSRRVCVRR